MDKNKAPIPFLTLTTREASVPALVNDSTLSPERLSELRTVLAAMADAPIATLEVHPLPEKLDRSTGIPLASASPLAQHLSQVISQSAKASPTANIGTGGEALYRMVVPAKVAAQFSNGLVKPMASKAAAGGIHGALTNASGVAAQATFVPVGRQAAAAGAAAGSAATAGATVAGASALTVAAPLVLMAVAVGVSAHAEQKRQQAIERITHLLEKLHDDKLEDERSQLDGCRDAIDKATTILLDQGKIGMSLGLDSSVFAINTAMERANRRLTRWREKLAELTDDRIELAQLSKRFPGIDETAGEFRSHLELASLAIALKRRVLILQAVEHAQLDSANPFENFTRTLKDDSERVDQLECGIADVLNGLARIELSPSRRIVDKVVSSGEADKLLRVSYDLRKIDNGFQSQERATDVKIDIARHADGSLLVLPAVAS